MVKLPYLLKKVQAVSRGGTTKDALLEMHKVLEWLFDMIKDEDSCEGSRLDNYKVEIHGRFRHLLNSLAALEARLCKVEAALGIEIKPWVPLEKDKKKERLKMQDVWG